MEREKIKKPTKEQVEKAVNFDALGFPSDDEINHYLSLMKSCEFGEIEMEKLRMLYSREES